MHFSISWGLSAISTGSQLQIFKETIIDQCQQPHPRASLEHVPLIKVIRF
jgi:hypothetical protein